MKLLMRTFAIKSVLDFGKYKGQTIETMLKIEPEYLAWIYYHYEKYSFVPAVLRKLNIKNELRIKKPMVNKEVFQLWKKTSGKSDFELLKKDLKKKYTFAKPETIVRYAYDFVGKQIANEREAQSKLKAVSTTMVWHAKGINQAQQQKRY